MWVYLMLWILERFFGTVLSSQFKCVGGSVGLVGWNVSVVQQIICWITDEHVSYRLEEEVINGKVNVVQSIKCPFKPSVYKPVFYDVTLKMLPYFIYFLPYCFVIEGTFNLCAKIPKSKFHVLPVYETQQSVHNLYNHRKAIKRFNFNSEIRLPSPLPLLI